MVQKLMASKYSLERCDRLVLLKNSFCSYCAKVIFQIVLSIAQCKGYFRLGLVSETFYTKKTLETSSSLKENEVSLTRQFA